MYKAIARRKVTQLFDALGRGDWEAAMADVAPDVHHVFPGDNAIGGERHSREAMERWFARLYRLIPEIQFEVRKVSVRGWPWDMLVAVEWPTAGGPATGAPTRTRVRTGSGCSAARPPTSTPTSTPRR